MGRNRKNSQIEDILSAWDRRNIPEMTKAQSVSIRLHMRSMSVEELTRLANDKKKPIYIVNIARGLLDKRAYLHQEKMDERDYGNAPQEVKIKKAGQYDDMSIEEMDAEIARLEAINGEE